MFLSKRFLVWRIKKWNVVWRTPKDTTVSSAEKQGLDYAHSDKAENTTKGSGITPQTTLNTFYKETISGGSTDIDPEPCSMQNGSATLQNSFIVI